MKLLFKTVCCFLVLTISISGLQAQNNIIINNDSIESPISIRFGQKSIEIVDGRVSVYDNKTKTHKPVKRKFNGHWAGFELGFNKYHNEDYSLYPSQDNNFMELREAKSIEVNLNPVEYNMTLVDRKAGLVTGIGFTINNYRFDKDLTIAKDESGIIQPFIPDGHLQKTKLVTSYLTVPLLLELHFGKKFFVSGGAVGGINIGSRTKIKIDGDKIKDRGNLNINPYRGSLMFRAGFKNISFYSTYTMTPLFKDNKGPELYTYSIGVSLVNF